MGLIPLVDGKIHKFGTNGLANGLSVIADQETWTLWDHITGEAFYGPLKGKQLKVFAIQMTTAEAVLAEAPNTPIFLSGYSSIFSRVQDFIFRKGHISSKGMLPAPFHMTMGTPIDPRLPKLEQGLGVMYDGKARFYPMRTIPKEGQLIDKWGGDTLVLARGEIDRVPYATWQADGSRPMQMLSRWYGFAFTYPTCTIYQPPSDESPR